MQQRDTFTVTEPGCGLDSHLWIIVSDPVEYPDQVFGLNVTTWCDGHSDNACILDVGDHPWIRRKSCIYYETPKIFINKQLDLLESKRLLTLHERLTESVFNRVLQGCMESRHLETGWVDMLVHQGVISYS